MRHIGFSTGAVAYSNFEAAINIMANEDLDSIELSALRLKEVEPLLQAIPHLNLARYTYISFHAPSLFTHEEEEYVASLIDRLLPKTWTIVLHPDTIHSFSRWASFGSRLAIENMDRRKATGRTVEELEAIYEKLPSASLCFDVGHARQWDTTMTEAYSILKNFGSRLVQVHVSEVNSASQHDPISYATKLAFRQIADLIPSDVPLIVESRVMNNKLRNEVEQVLDVFSIPSQVCV